MPVLKWYPRELKNGAHNRKKKTLKATCMALSIPQTYTGRTGLLICLRIHTDKWALNRVEVEPTRIMYKKPAVHRIRMSATSIKKINGIPEFTQTPCRHGMSVRPHPCRIIQQPHLSTALFASLISHG